VFEDFDGIGNDDEVAGRSTATTAVHGHGDVHLDAPLAFLGVQC